MKEFRKDYKLGTLNDSEADNDPFKQFTIWFDQVKKLGKELGKDSGLVEPNAFSLSTATKTGMPSSRTLLLKDFTSDGFTFFTNYESRKGRELEENPTAAMLFYWPELERQVRIEGQVSKISPEVSDKYFAERPFESQISASISVQSSKVGSREILESRWQSKKQEALNMPLKRPASWGGYRLEPVYFEFWQGRENRLHDRLEYKKTSGGSWQINRLSP